MPLLPKPDHLAPEFARQFQDASVVASYHHRPPYPDAVFDILDGLIQDEPRTVLDVGAGTGAIARLMAQRGARVDAVDPSAGMIENGRKLPGGDHPDLTWIAGMAEDAPLRPPYALITAAASLHWMEWFVVLPRFRDLLTPHGVLAIILEREGPYPWYAEVLPVIQRTSTNRTFRPYNVVDELETRELFRQLGRRGTDPQPYTRSVDEYVESFHARNGLSRDRLEPEAARAFDRDVAAIVGPYAIDGVLALRVAADVIWDMPAPS
ncbi:MAG TPA: class I SAM-dependent methyltransferase [Thermomicrobiales bacterium]|nr:class I SAM-dependent methyltransferase [Thermomicrobiales bacterium]